MITLKPIAWRLLMLASLSVFSVMCSTKNTEDTEASEGTEDTQTIQDTVHVSDSTSIGYELADCNSDNLDPIWKEYCADLRKLKAGITLCMDGSLTTGSCPKFMLTKRIEPPIVCPEGQCIPFLKTHLVRFFTEKASGPVEILVNDKLVGTAEDVSYDSVTKHRIVFFDLKSNFKNTNGEGQNVMIARFPVIYNKSGQDVQSMLVVNVPF